MLNELPGEGGGITTQVALCPSLRFPSTASQEEQSVSHFQGLAEFSSEGHGSVAGEVKGAESGVCG